MTEAIAELATRLSRPDGVRRLGQALWMLVGRDVLQSELVWASSLLGYGGDLLLWRVLCEEGAVRPPAVSLRPNELANLLCRLWGDEADRTDTVPRLVWTLPRQLSVSGLASDSYASAAIGVVNEAKETVLLVSPYLETRGMGHLHAALLDSLHRGVEVTVLTHDADDLSSLASAALRHLRQDAPGASGKLTVFTAAADPEVLLHLKVVVSDGTRAIVGSANVTSKGLGTNLEAGVILGKRDAAELERVVRAVISQQLAKLAFSTS